MTPEERLIAYVDGELAADQRARFEAELAADPGLAAEVARHRALAARIADAYAPVLDQPVPPRLAAGVIGPSTRKAPPGLPTWAALAASLVLGVGLGRLALPPSGALALQGGDLVARGGLGRALDRDLASQPGPVRIGLTFRSADGRYCRTFESRRLAGLACRQDGRWVASVVAAAAPAAETAYRTAASGAPPAVLAAVDATIVGAPLDAAAERRARDAGWRP